MADNGLINTKAADGLGAPVTAGVDFGTPWSTQTEGFAGYSLGLSVTGDLKLPFNSSRYTFQDDKGKPLFVTGIALGLGLSPTFNLVRDATKSGPVSIATELPLEFRVPIPLGNSALVVLYTKPKGSFSAAEAPPAPVEGVTPDPTAEVHLVPTATAAFTWTTGGAFYLSQQKEGKNVVGSPLLDANVTYAPLSFVDGAFTFANIFNPDSTIPKTEWSFTLQPLTAWTSISDGKGGKFETGLKFNYKYTSAAREVKDADGEIVPDYRDVDHSLTLTAVTPFIRDTKLNLKLTGAWTDPVGEDFYHYGAGNAHGRTLGATATLKTPWALLGKSPGKVSVDQGLLELEDRERLDQLPFEASVGYSQKEQTYGSEGEFLYSEGAPVLGADGLPIAYDGSGTPYDVAHLPNSDPSINDVLARTLTFGIKAAVPLGPGEATLTINLPYNISPGAENEGFLQRFRDPTGSNHTLAIAYEMPLGGGESRGAKVGKNSVATRVMQEWSFIRDDLTRPEDKKGKYKFTDDQAFAARDIVVAYMTAKDTNWTDLQKEFDDLVADKEKDNSDLTMADFIIILEWSNDNDNRGIGSFKAVAAKKGLSLHEFAQEWKAEKAAKAAE